MKKLPDLTGNCGVLILSKLDEDIRRTEEFGYGVSYGKYKADHPALADTKTTKEIADFLFAPDAV